MILHSNKYFEKAKWEYRFRLARTFACARGIIPGKAKLDRIEQGCNIQNDSPPVLIHSLERKKNWRRSLGFTLTEMLLTVSLMAIFMGATVFTFSTLGPSNRLEEGTAQFESLVRYARAYAANSGKQVQISFSDTAVDNLRTNSQVVRLEWEPDPLGQPGHFEEIPETVHYTQGLEDLVQIRSVAIRIPGQLDSTTISETNDPIASLEVPILPPLVFYPDGSCDSAEILIGSQTEEDLRQMSIQIVGITGSISHKIIDPEGMDEEEVVYEPDESDATLPPPSTLVDNDLTQQGL